MAAPSRRLTPVLAAALLWCGLVGVAARAAAADRITLSNGDILTGAVVSRSSDVLVLDSELAGRITIPARAVRSVASSSAGPGSGAGWRGTVGADTAVSRGNADTLTLGANASLAHATDAGTIGLYGNSLFSSVGIGDSAVTTSRSNRGGLRYDRAIAGRLFGFGFGDVENDPLQLLDLRLVAGGGAGLRVTSSDNGAANIFGGISYARDTYTSVVTTTTTTATTTTGTTDKPVTPATGGVPPGQGGTIPGRTTRQPPAVVNSTLARSAAEWVVGHDAWLSLGSRAWLTERVTLFPALSNPSDYRLSFDASVTAQLNGWLQWHLSVTDRYLRIPPAGGAVRNDLYIGSGFGITLGDGRGQYSGADAPAGRLRRTP